MWQNLTYPYIIDRLKLSNLKNKKVSFSKQDIGNYIFTIYPVYVNLSHIQMYYHIHCLSSLIVGLWHLSQFFSSRIEITVQWSLFTELFIVLILARDMFSRTITSLEMCLFNVENNIAYSTSHCHSIPGLKGLCREYYSWNCEIVLLLGPI